MYGFLHRLAPNPYRGTTKGYYVIKALGRVTPGFVYFNKDDFEKASERHSQIIMIAIGVCVTGGVAAERFGIPEWVKDNLLLCLIAIMIIALILQYFAYPKRCTYRRKDHGDLIELNRNTTGPASKG